MKKTTMKSSILALGVMSLGAAAVWAQPASPTRPYDQQFDRREERRYRERDLLALQDDLRLVDDALSTFPQGSRRFAEFQDRAEGIRAEVVALANDNNRRGPNRPGEGQVEIASLRLKIATLRDDIEDAQSRRRTGSFRIPAGTEITVILNQDLSSRVSSPEDRIEASTITAIRMDGRTVIPAGATVTGAVREVRSRRRGQADSWLKVDFDSLVPERGPTVPIRSHVVSISQSRDNDTVRNGGLGALLGGVIGGIIDGKKGALIGAVVGASGGILASQDGDVDLPEGTLITLRLDGPMMIARR